MSKSIKVRFNLGRGMNYLKWKVTYPDGDIVYYDPNVVQLVMTDCVFKNQKKTAQRIFDGGEKVVCAWILCKHIQIHDHYRLHTDDSRQVRYNPRVQPNWLYDGQIMDGDGMPKLHTINRGVFITEGSGEISLATK